jgi:SAM-dependent methyltransferase
MFFPDRIRSILHEDRVLEVGPGSMPHPRSQVFLEKRFSEAEARAQRGGLPALKFEQPVVHFDGSLFPFQDNEFDYVICSHVLEHVDDVELFLAELARVASRGYLEFPTVYYEYLYSFREHRNLLRYRDGTILWLPKNETRLIDFDPIQSFLRSTLEAGYDEVVQSLKDCFFEGFEWTAPLGLDRAASLLELLPTSTNVRPRADLPQPASSKELVSELIRRLGRKMRRVSLGR